ncbi:MAG: hypothetical protein FWE67_01995 [Planctomycetaceae bacterium]|nr:hypothetical protein [Planctomycetaceae bacterium]
MLRLLVFVFILLFGQFAFAQSRPSTGNTGSIGENSSFDIGTMGSSAASDVNRFEGIGDMNYVGIRDNVPFVGRERPFETSRSSRTSNVRTSSAGARRTTAARTSAARGTAAGSRMSTAADRNKVRAAATTEFNYPQLSLEQKAIGFSTSLSRIPNLPFDSEKIHVNIDTVKSENVATVSGTVTSEHSKKVLKQLLLLEPGIDRVESKVTVGSQ